MKRFVITLFLMTLTTGVVLGRLVGYDHRKPPRLPLPDAYSLALGALGTSTNAFHCYDARCTIVASQDGEWQFTFSNTNGALKTVTVFFNKETHVLNGTPEMY